MRLAAVIGEPNAVSNAIGYAMVESRQSRIGRGQPKEVTGPLCAAYPAWTPYYWSWRWQRTLHNRGRFICLRRHSGAL